MLTINREFLKDTINALHHDNKEKENKLNKLLENMSDRNLEFLIYRIEDNYRTTINELGNDFCKDVFYWLEEK